MTSCMPTFKMLTPWPSEPPWGTVDSGHGVSTSFSPFDRSRNHHRLGMVDLKVSPTLGIEGPLCQGYGFSIQKFSSVASIGGSQGWI